MNITEIKLDHTVGEFSASFAIDSKQFCLNKPHFFNYPKTIFYYFNRLGYRDHEWDGDVSNGIWCVGDSFTVGLGQPFEEIWPQLVQEKLGQKTFNMSMNGASNDWISRRIQFILDNFEPSLLLVQWSYLHRRENPNTLLSDEARALHFDQKMISDIKEVAILDNEDVDNCLKNILSISNTNNVRIIHSFIPNFFNTNTDLSAPIYKALVDNNIEFFPAQDQIDFARDHFHYDILTATSYADKYVERLQT